MENIAKEITHLLYDTGIIKTWYNDNPEGWVLHSGIWSPFYIQLRGISNHSNSKQLLLKVAQGLEALIKEKAPETTRLVGVAMAGIPLAVALTMVTGLPSCYTRSFNNIEKVTDVEKEIKKMKKKYGEPRLIEGKISEGDNLLLVDDLVTDFDSKLIAKKLVSLECQKRRMKNVKCNNVLVLLDREQGAINNAKNANMKLFSLIPFKSEGINWLKNKMSKSEHEIIVDYLKDPEKYQDKKLQKEMEDMAKNKD